MSNTAEPAAEPTPEALTLPRAVDARRDHVRGGNPDEGATSLVIYGDYLCPYCRRVRFVIARLRETLGEQLAYVFRHFPNEHAHPGAEFLSLAAEAAGREIAVDVPEPNTAAVALAERAGLTPSFETARMYTGLVRSFAEERVYGVTTLELG